MRRRGILPRTRLLWRILRSAQHVGRGSFIEWALTAGAIIEQRECGKAIVERQNQLASLDLGDFPAADIVADSRTHDLLLRAGANNRARALPVHHDAN